jgi:acyl-CoA synthetase (AMP-forming)/AMP-acid ligase II
LRFLSEHPDQRAGLAIEHPDFGEGVTAIVVREKGAAVDEATIAAALEETLAKYKQPKRILFGVIDANPLKMIDGTARERARRGRNAGTSGLA